MMEWEMHPATQPATIAYKQLLAKVVNKNVGHVAGSKAISAFALQVH